MVESNILDLFGTFLGKPSIVFNSIIRVLLYRLKRLLPRPSSKRGRFINISFLLAYEKKLGQVMLSRKSIKTKRQIVARVIFLLASCAK